MTTNFDKFFHSVYLDADCCRGCTHCMRNCPTQAIRVVNRKSFILSKYCIDCGECVRRCKHMARRTRYDSHRKLDDFQYTVVLPDPVIYSQFNHLKDVNILLTALKMLGFDDVFEVSAAAELVSEVQREYMAAHPGEGPFISTVCPVVTRLVRVRFPGLLDNLIPVLPPMEIAAQIARKRACEKTGLDPEQIGIFYISPCVARVTAVKSPLGFKHSNIDRVIAIKKVYPSLLTVLPQAREHVENLSVSGRIGNCFSISGGESRGTLTERYMAVDGVENIIKILEDLEDDKLQTDVDFIELSACPAGCVGGVLTVENPFIARTKTIAMFRDLPKFTVKRCDYPDDIEFMRRDPIQYEPVFELGENFRESMAMMATVEAFLKKLPGLDCGCCGSPTCRCLAIDVVKGHANLNRCIYRKTTDEGDMDCDYSEAY